MNKIKISFTKELLDVENVEVVTRIGEKARVICTDANVVDGETVDDEPIVALINGEPKKFYEDGKYFTTVEDDLDLFMEVDVDAVKERLGFDPMLAAMISSLLFGDPKQYTPEELELITHVVALLLLTFE